MFPSELLTANKKIMHVYESFCTPLCKKYQLNQSDLDLILFMPTIRCTTQPRMSVKSAESKKALSRSQRKDSLKAAI